MEFIVSIMKQVKTSKDIASDSRVFDIWKEDGHWNCLLKSRYEISFGVFSLEADFLCEPKLSDICDYFNNADWTRLTDED